MHKMLSTSESIRYKNITYSSKIFMFCSTYNAYSVNCINYTSRIRVKKANWAILVSQSKRRHLQSIWKQVKKTAVIVIVRFFFALHSVIEGSRILSE